jgi:hypothetical protein
MRDFTKGASSDTERIGNFAGVTRKPTIKYVLARTINSYLRRLLVRSKNEPST